MCRIVTAFVLLLSSYVLAVDVNEPNLPDLTLWGYQGWHPVNAYNEMTVGDFNSINPFHCANVYLPDFVSVKVIKTKYLREGALITIDGATVGDIYLTGAGTLVIKNGCIGYVEAEDYSKVFYYTGEVESFVIQEAAELHIAGDWNYDNKVNFIDLAIFARVADNLEDVEYICNNWLKSF